MFQQIIPYLTVLIVVIGSPLAWAQSSTQGSTTIQGRTLRTQSGAITAQSGGSTTQTSSSAEKFQQDFWRYLTRGPFGYDQWGPFPGQDPGIYEGQSPHGAYLRLYANKTARANPKELPDGSIIIKENYGQDRQTLMAVTVMYRASGYDPEHFDWYWIKYNPDGTVARTPPDAGSRPIAGRFASCIDCHSGAEGGDFAFAND